MSLPELFQSWLKASEWSLVLTLICGHANGSCSPHLLMSELVFFNVDTNEVDCWDCCDHMFRLGPRFILMFQLGLKHSGRLVQQDET